MDSLLFLFLLGALIVVIGIRNLKGDVAAPRGNGRTKVSEEDRIPFGKKLGTGTVLVGAAVIARAFAGLAADRSGMPLLNTIGTGVLIAGLAAGAGFIFYALIRYGRGAS